MLRDAGVKLRQNTSNAADYFSIMRNFLGSSGHEQKAFADAYKRMGKLLTNNPTTFTEYYQQNRERLVSNLRPEHYGKLIMFRYNAKWKDELPYWDRYPLVMPVRTEGKYLTGLNFHYLFPQLRAKLLDAIVDNNARNRFYDNRRIRINMNIIARAAQSRLYEPCVKKYILQSKHVQTQFLIVPPEDYKFVLFLPYEMFQKESKEYVWADSIRKIRKAAH